jgi:hypothetical protein
MNMGEEDCASWRRVSRQNRPFRVLTQVSLSDTRQYLGTLITAFMRRSTITGESAILVFNTKNKRRDMWERERGSCCGASNGSAPAGVSGHFSVQYREPTTWMFNLSNILDNAQFGSV